MEYRKLKKKWRLGDVEMRRRVDNGRSVGRT